MADGENTREAHEPADPLQEAAAGWVVRLQASDVTPAERAAFAAWRDASPAHAEAYAEMREIWHTLGQLPDPRRRRSGRGGLASLAAAALIAGALAQHLGLVDRFRADLWSDVGEIAGSALPDGSRVDLNTDTALALHFTDRERGVDLLRGEASFDVVADPARPFVVHANGLDVRAVGTRFFVRADGTESPVGVSDGRVEVATVGRHVLVSAGEALRIAGDAPAAVAKADIERRMAWKGGRLLFSDQPLATVLHELERYRRGRILLLDARAGERRVTGAFDPHATDDALAVLAATMGVRVTHLTPLLVLVGSPL